MCIRDSFIYAAVGVHPSDIADLNEETFAWLREQTAWEMTVAVGEIEVYKRQPVDSSEML